MAAHEPLSSFSLFTLLPAELRLEIWRQSCQPRVVQVNYSSEEDRCRTTTNPPVILQVCRESRQEGLRIYTQCFGTNSNAGLTYFCPTMDVLYIPRRSSMGYGEEEREFASLVPQASEHVQQLAVDHVKPEIRRPWETYNKYCLMRNFPLLKRAFLVLPSVGDEPQEQGGGPIEFVDPKGDQDALLKLMDDVQQSFSYEVGTNIGLCEEQVDADPGCCEPPLALIPKAKSIQTWTSQTAGVTCV